MKIRVGVVGVSGYSGLELIRLLLKHPAVDFVAVMDAEEIGEKPLQDIHPCLRGVCSLSTFPPDRGRLAALHPDTCVSPKSKSALKRGLNSPKL